MGKATYEVPPGSSFIAIIGGAPDEQGRLSPSYPPADLPGALGPPAVAPAAAAAAGAGLGIGTYRYRVTFVSAYGETAGGPEVTVTTSSGNQQVALSAIPAGPAGTTQRRIYRTAVGGASGSEQFAHTLADNTTLVWTDALADGGLGVAPPALDQSGALGVQVIPLAGGTPVLPRTTAGVQQQLPHSGVYSVQLTAPTWSGLDTDPIPSGSYTVLWDYNRGAAPFFTQTLAIDTSIPVTPQSGASLQPVYVTASSADPTAITVSSYIPGLVIDDLPTLNRVIVEAELEIDSILGFWIRDPSTGRKVNMTNIVPVAPISPFPGELFAPYQRGITIYQKAALQMAVCAQVEYHLKMGPDFFRKPQYASVSGPQFSRTGYLGGSPYIAPKARQHLAQMGLQRQVARALI